MLSAADPAAWLRRERIYGALIAVALLVLHMSLPGGVGSAWRTPAAIVVIALIIALLALNPFLSLGRAILLRRLSLVLIVALSLSNLVTLITVVVSLAASTGALSPAQVLRTGLTVWVMNIALFTLWYWELDAGGPALRAQGSYQMPAFYWPQLQAPGLVNRPWQPHLGDYLALAAFTSLAFAPSDTPPLRVWAKLAMALQAGISFGLAALVVARAINILGT